MLRRSRGAMRNATCGSNRLSIDSADRQEVRKNSTIGGPNGPSAAEYRSTVGCTPDGLAKAPGACHAVVPRHGGATAMEGLGGLEGLKSAGSVR